MPAWAVPSCNTCVMGGSFNGDEKPCSKYKKDAECGVAGNIRATLDDLNLESNEGLLKLTIMNLKDAIVYSKMKDHFAVCAGEYGKQEQKFNEGSIIANLLKMVKDLQSSGSDGSEAENWYDIEPGDGEDETTT